MGVSECVCERGRGVMAHLVLARRHAVGGGLALGHGMGGQIWGNNSKRARIPR